MEYTFEKGATSQSIELYIVDATDGTPETGVVFNTAGIDLKYRRKDAAAVSITEADLTTPILTDTWETGGFLEIGNGVYRLDLPDAAIASSAGIDRVVVFGTVTGMVVLPVTIHLVDYDPSGIIPTVGEISDAVAGAVPTIGEISDAVAGAVPTIGEISDAVAGAVPTIGEISDAVAGAVPTIGEISDAMAQELTDYDAPTYKEMSDAFVAISDALTVIKGAGWDAAFDSLAVIGQVASDILADTAVTPPTIGEISDAMAQELTDYPVPKIGDISDAVATELADYDPPTKTEMDTAFTEIKGATWAAGNDTLEIIGQRVSDIIADTAVTPPTIGEISDAVAGAVPTIGEISDAVAGAVPTIGEISDAVATELGDYDGPTYKEMSDAFVEIKGAGWDAAFDSLAIIGQVTSDILADTAAALTIGAISDAVVKALSDSWTADTVAEMGAGALTVTPTKEQMLNYHYRTLRNKTVTTASDISVYNDAGAGVLFWADLSTNADSDFTKGEFDNV